MEASSRFLNTELIDRHKAGLNEQLVEKVDIINHLSFVTRTASVSNVYYGSEFKNNLCLLVGTTDPIILRVRHKMR